AQGLWRNLGTWPRAHKTFASTSAATTVRRRLHEAEATLRAGLLSPRATKGFLTMHTKSILFISSLLGLALAAGAGCSSSSSGSSAASQDSGTGDDSASASSSGGGDAGAML